MNLSILVDGYIRSVVYDNTGHREYEEMLSRLIVEYSSLMDYFEHYNAEKIRVNEARDTITKLTGDLASCYGVVKIPSLEKGIHRWTFKVREQSAFTGIGIDETKYLRKDQGFFANMYWQQISIMHGLWSDGQISSATLGVYNRNRYKSVMYEKGDVVEMTLDLKARTLEFLVNEKGSVVLADISTGEDIEYAMVVCLYETQDCIQLLSYECE